MVASPPARSMVDLSIRELLARTWTICLSSFVMMLTCVDSGLTSPKSFLNVVVLLLMPPRSRPPRSSGSRAVRLHERILRGKVGEASVLRQRVACLVAIALEPAQSLSRAGTEHAVDRLPEVAE